MKYPNNYCKDWHTKFAYLPINIDGYSVWLEYYVVRYVPTDCSCGSFYISGKWEYKRIKKKVSDVRLFGENITNTIQTLKAYFSK